MNEELLKSLTALIDESLAEIEELKKSDRFSASEIKIGDDASHIKDKDKNGSLGKDEGKEDEDEEDEDEEHEEEEAKKAEKDEDKKEDKKEEDKKDLGEEIKKSQDEVSTLMKSYIDTKIAPIESKIDSLANLIKELADSPVSSRGASYKSVAPLKKSEDAQVETLTKSQVIDKLFELKKSGTAVDSTDIAAAELGGPNVLSKITAKYDIK
jgi:cobalamin biosynthesis protein CobT